VEPEREIFNLDKEIDCVGLFCPMPIIKTREAIREIQVGQLLGMVADDPASDADMRAWSKRAGHELLEVSKHGGIYRFVVRRTR
jgi:tRNA 2-thiouridine synthesizing protein A